MVKTIEGMKMWP